MDTDLQYPRRCGDEGIVRDAPDSADVRFRARILGWMNDFLATHVEAGQGPNPDEPVILCVSHGAYLSTLFGLLLSPEFKFAAAPGIDKSRHCLNTSVMRVRVTYDPKEGEWDGEVLSWGEVCHLDGVESGIPVADDIRDSFRKAMAQA